MPRYYETDQFKALHAEWQSRLAASGFKDIEDRGDYDEDILPDNIILTSRRVERGIMSGRAEWYRMAYEFTDQVRFAASWQRWAWVLYTEGWNIEEIGGRLPCPSRYRLRKVIADLSHAAAEFGARRVEEEERPGRMITVIPDYNEEFLRVTELLEKE